MRSIISTITIAEPLVAHFGLGNATNVEALRIEWPSGIVQTLTNIAPRQFLTAMEHQVIGATITPPKFTDLSPSTLGSVTLTAVGDAGVLYLFEASTNLANWTWLGVRSNVNGSIQFNGPHAANYDARFYRVSIP